MTLTFPDGEVVVISDASGDARMRSNVVVTASHSPLRPVLLRVIEQWPDAEPPTKADLDPVE
jgi:hypothetical protein